MDKYLITWDAGYGESADVYEADSLEDAEQAAHDSWQQEAESSAVYGAELLTKDNAEDYGFEGELDG